MSRWRDEAAAALLALQFLTRIPSPIDPGYSPERMAASPRWYPAVGLVVGSLCAAILGVAAWLWPLPVAVILTVAAGLMITGALHEDGFADVCDGLGGGRTADRAMEIMRDSRLGAYGAIGLVLLLVAKVATLASLPLSFAMAALVAGHAASRGAAVLVMATSTYARSAGAAAPVSAGIGPGALAFALLTSAAAFVPLIVLSVPVALCGAVGLAIGFLLMRSRFQKRLGGYTGDCLGAVQQLSEVGLYLGVLAWL